MKNSLTISSETENYLKTIQIPIRLACVSDSGWPLVLSLWYLYREGQFYCATHRKAKIIGHLQREKRCGFEIASDIPPYCGVRGQGIATIDESLGEEILKQLLNRYLGSLNTPLSQKLLARSQDEVAIVIKPINLFRWNYTQRMEKSLSKIIDKPCPPSLDDR